MHCGAVLRIESKTRPRQSVRRGGRLRRGVAGSLPAALLSWFVVTVSFAPDTSAAPALRTVTCRGDRFGHRRDLGELMGVAEFAGAENNAPLAKRRGWYRHRNGSIVLRVESFIRFGLLWPAVGLSVVCVIGGLFTGWYAIVITPVSFGAGLVAIRGARAALTVSPSGIEVRSVGRRRVMRATEIRELVIRPAPRPRENCHQVVAVKSDGSAVRLDLSTVRTYREGFSRLTALRDEMAAILCDDPGAVN